jgi:hypothetical protein
MAEEWLASRSDVETIIHEFSVADWGGASVDVAAITPTHIVGVEIKGEGDSPARLALQGCMYSRVVKEMWLLPSPVIAEKIDAKRPRGWARLEVHEGRVRPENKWSFGSVYEPVPHSFSNHLCAGVMCETLWRDELYAIAKSAGLAPRSRARVKDLTDLLVNNLTTHQIHERMVEALRRRAWRRPVRKL